MNRFELSFDLTPLGPLDGFALLATQEYNFGEGGNWFYYFRSGIQGVRARLYGVAFHYHEVHAWRPRIRTLTETEYHLSSIFFNMDSALECFIFAVNAFGAGAESNLFLDVSDHAKLTRISPSNILGTWNHSGDQTRGPLPGYAKYFPGLQKYWQDQREFLDLITEQHDASKHRSRILTGGSIRKDPPPGFFESLGVPEDKSLRHHFHPMEEIILDSDPKGPVTKRKSIPFEQIANLEAVGDAFRRFINESCVRVLTDAWCHINLRHYSFLKLTNISVVKHADVPLYQDADCTKVRTGVVGVIIKSGTVEFGLKHERIVPTARINYYTQDHAVSSKRNSSNRWGECWYVHPDTGEKKKAWDGSAEFVGDMLGAGGIDI